MQLDDARRLFDRYVSIEPRLAPLWEMCRAATPVTQDMDAEDLDVDPNDGWCAEMFFFERVKTELEELVGWYRVKEPAALRSSDAYDDVYAALQVALNRTCSCCRESSDAR